MAKKTSSTKKQVRSKTATASPAADAKSGPPPAVKTGIGHTAKKSAAHRNGAKKVKLPAAKEPVKTPPSSHMPATAASDPTVKESSQPAEKLVKPTSPSTPSKPASEPPAPMKPEPESVPEPATEKQPATQSKRPDAAQPMPMQAEAESVHVEEPVPDEMPAQMPVAEQRPELFIVHISPEMAPVAKVGGLADVVFGLTGELAIRGNHVEVILPKYDNLRYDHVYELHEVYNDLWVPWYDGAIHCTVYFGFVHDRKCFFIEPHSGDNFFNRGSIYGFPDDILRFAFFSRAAMEFLWMSGKHPDIIHCHDWQTALVPVLLYEIYQQMGMTHPRACFTIHNYKHQGVTGMEMLRAAGLHDPDRFFDYNRLRDNNNLHALNLLKGGIVYSNFITTVSPRYAVETRDQGQGFGLEPTLHTHQMKYGGVLNGIDYDAWNPEVDHLLPARYGSDNIDPKYDNKRALRHRLMLMDNDKPIVAFIGR
ncbi:MAG: glycogen/starch synthase, partial [Pseudomonadota bacterium]